MKGELPKEWKKYRLKEVLHRVRKPVEVIPSDLYRELGIRSHGKGIFYKEPKTGKELGNKAIFWIEPDCLIVNIVFAWELAVAKTTKSEKGMVASHRFPQFQPKNNLTDIDFFLAFLKTPQGKELLELASPGGAGRNKTLGQKEFESVEIAIPPLPEQQKIARILSTWDAAIDCVQKLLANSRQQKKALMQQLLTGKKRLPDFSGEWKTKKLTKLADIFMGTSPSSHAYNSHGEGLPLIQGNADIKKGVSVPRIYTSVVTQPCEVNDILLTVRAPVGTVAISLHKACIGRGIAALRNKDGVSQDYLRQFFIFFQLQWKNYSQGSTFDSITSAELKHIHINIPNGLPEQTAIAKVLSVADAVISQYEAKLANLQSQKKALMQQLLTGKKRVKADAPEEVS